MKNTLIYLSIALLLFSCSNDDPVTDCSLIIPPPNNILLRIQDDQNNPLIGTEFTQDSFRLRGNSMVTYVKPDLNGNPIDLSIFFTQMADGVDYYLDLSETDTDTLRANYTASINECFTAFNLVDFEYNDQLVTDFNGENLVVVTKD